MSLFGQEQAPIGSVLDVRLYTANEDEQRTLFPGLFSASTSGTRHGQAKHLLCHHFGSYSLIPLRINA